MPRDPILSQLALAAEFTGGRPCTPADVSDIEASSGGVLPDDYRAFLVEFGCAIFDGGMVYGRYELGSLLPASYDLDAIRQTVKQRGRRLPACFAADGGAGLVIAKFDGGGFYFLRTGSTRHGAVDLFEFHEEAGPVKNWESWSGYVLWLLRVNGYGTPAGT